MGGQFPFSKRRIEALGLPASGREQFRDARTPGLVLRVTPNGTKTFSVYKKVAGRPLRCKLGTFPEMTVEQARKQARRRIGAMADGVDPVAARRAIREAPTLQDLFDHWIAHAKAHKKTWKDDQRQFEKYMGRLKNRRLTEISTADVAKWHRRIAQDHGPYMANRCRALLSAMFNKGHEIGHADRNPCEGVKRFQEESRDRFLQPAEMRPFFAALKEEPPLWRDFWLLALFSGARRGNVAGMAWKDIDLDAGVWYLPGWKTKGGLPLAIVLPPPAVAILRTRHEDCAGSPWVFPADTASGHIVDPRKSWRRVLKASGIENLRPHDLRRSLGSWQAIAGASLPIIGASLGHRDPKATAVYARLQLDPVRTSVNGAVESMLAAGGLLEGPTEEGDGDDA